MEANSNEEEYVLLDLDGVYGLIDIPPNANYVLQVLFLHSFIFSLLLIFNTSLLVYLIALTRPLVGSVSGDPHVLLSTYVRLDSINSLFEIITCINVVPGVYVSILAYRNYKYPDTIDLVSNSLMILPT